MEVSENYEPNVQYQGMFSSCHLRCLDTITKLYYIASYLLVSSEQFNSHIHFKLVHLLQLRLKISYKEKIVQERKKMVFFLDEMDKHSPKENKFISFICIYHNLIRKIIRDPEVKAICTLPKML